MIGVYLEVGAVVSVFGLKAQSPNRGRDSPKATPPSEPDKRISRIRLSSHGFTRLVLADVCRTRDSPFGLFDQTETGRRLH